MKYKIFSYCFDEDAMDYQIKSHYKETLSHRVAGNNHFVTLMSHDQLKNRHNINKFSHLTPVHEFEISGRNEAISVFEEFINKEYDLESYSEMTSYKIENKIDEAAWQIDAFISMEKKEHVFYKSGAKDRHCNFVYFLKDKGTVVYVGQSINISRPWEHTDKIWDEVKIIEVPLQLNLNLIEGLYINKFKPKYNKGLPFSTIIINEALKKVIENRSIEK